MEQMLSQIIITIFLCGDVMPGRGIDQILPYPSVPTIHESCVRDARDYVNPGKRFGTRVEMEEDSTLVLHWR